MNVLFWCHKNYKSLICFHFFFIFLISSSVGIVKPTDDTQLNDAKGICKNLLVLDTNNHNKSILTKPEVIHAIIPIRFKLDSAGFVTLVIENKSGIRVRNIVSNQWFKAGQNVVWWDGLDDLGRDVDAAKHGLYRIPSHLVDPGEYRVKGLVHKEVKPIYEFPFYAAGRPPWVTKDHTSGWLANHTPPQAALFVPSDQSPTGEPAVYLGCYITEGSDGLAWVDLDGKKRGGKNWVGGIWTAAPYLARDAGKERVPGVFAYVASAWSTGKNTGKDELRINALTDGKDKQVLTSSLGDLDKKYDVRTEVGGIAVNNGLAVVSLKNKNSLLFIDLKLGTILSRFSIFSPMGLAFDTSGRLLVLTGKNLVRFRAPEIDSLSSPEVLIHSALEAPIGLTLDEKGNIYISDGGNSHQVKVFSSSGEFIRSIGKPGLPHSGPYDESHMNNPSGITVDSKQQLWVTECDYLPKRVSVWTLDGHFIRAFYGPAKYGGGGTIDSKDKNHLYYAEGGGGAMDFLLNWNTGESKLCNVYYRSQPDDFQLPRRNAAPETAIYLDGKKYFTNAYNTNPTAGHSSAFVFIERNGIAVPVAGIGQAESWDILKQDDFKERWPKDEQASHKRQPNHYFLWSDLNANGKIEASEVAIRTGLINGITVMPDLSFCAARLNGNSIRYLPERIDGKSIPLYDIDKGQIIATEVLSPASSGGNQVLQTLNGWYIVTLGVKPFAQSSISGVKNGVAMWSYPSLWPGLHASHEAPIPDFQGELIGTTRLLGGEIRIDKPNNNSFWAINSNHGMVYIFSNDGLFVTTLFQPMRVGKRWDMPVIKRGTSIDSMTLGEENFWPTIVRTKDDSVYIVNGSTSSIIRISGLGSVKRLHDFTINVTKSDIEKNKYILNKQSMALQNNEGLKLMDIPIQKQPKIIDGNLDDWKESKWVEIEKGGVRAYFNSNTKPYDIKASVTTDQENMYVAYQTGDSNILKNSGEQPTAPFKTGGALDLMIGSDEKAHLNRQTATIGDLRITVTIINGKVNALIYRKLTKDREGDGKVSFSSPSRTVVFDQVEDISRKIKFAGKQGNFEVSIPLDVIGLKISEGTKIRGDIGILRGDGTRTISRAYWSNKATAIISDVPSEADLEPAMWGVWTFK